MFVGDAKYKKTKAPGINHPDLYQLLAYTVAAGVRTGLLIYVVGEEFEGKHTVENAGKELHLTTLDLSGTPSELLKEIDRIANLVRELRDQPLPLLSGEAS